VRDTGGSRSSIIGLLLSVGFIGVLLAAGAFLVFGRGADTPVVSVATDGASATAAPAATEGLVAAAEAPRFTGLPATYTPTNNVFEVELSEYAGYAGLIVANGGLAPNPESVFAKKHGFQVSIKLSEEEASGRLLEGKLAATATTVDVLAVYGRQYSAQVPVQIGFSRGADGLVVRKGIKRLNDLRGKIVVAAQYNESEFLLRYLAQEAGIPVKVLADPSEAVGDAIGLVYAEDAFAAGDAFLADVANADGRLAGCVTWEPKTGEVVQAAAGKADVLVTNRNLLVVADVLVVNRGLAEANPALVRGLVEGILEGNDRVRRDPTASLDVIAKAFGWSPNQATAELQKVHLSNLPENRAFLDGDVDMAGSFAGIFQSAVYAYGRDVVKDPASPASYVNTAALEAIAADGLFADQRAELEPVRTGATGTVESDPLLSKDIRFLFEPNSSILDMKDPENLADLKAIRRLLDVSPGSTVLLRGHVDNARKAEFTAQGGEPFVRKMALKAVKLSEERASEIEQRLVEVEKADDKRVETVGVGWDEPGGTDPEKNRRVEVQWFTIE
jgi:NitT/TauT family transport system substrate-binding protein